MRSPCPALIGLTVLSALTACTAIQNSSEVREGARYKDGESGSARVGEVMIDRYRYRTEILAQPLAIIPAASGRLQVRSGATLVGRKVDGEFAFCTRLEGNFACFFDADADKAFDHVKVVNLGIASSKQVLTPAAPYTLSDAPRATGYRYELVYEGRSEQVIDLSYREFIDDMSRPAFEQDLHYTLTAEGTTEITFRSARLRIAAADNQAIRFDILSGLNQ